MHRFKTFKKYGTTVAVTLMMSAMLCGTPDLAYADSASVSETDSSVIVEKSESKKVSESSGSVKASSGTASTSSNSGTASTSSSSGTTSTSSSSGTTSTSSSSGTTSTSSSSETVSRLGAAESGSGSSGASVAESGSESSGASAAESGSGSSGASATESDSESSGASAAETNSGDSVTPETSDTQNETQETAETKDAAETQETAETAETQETAETAETTETETETSAEKDSEKKVSKTSAKKVTSKSKSSASSSSSSSSYSSSSSSGSSSHSGVAAWKGHDVDLPDLIVKKELRFKTVTDVTYKAVSKKLTVYEEMKDSSKEVGYVNAGGQVTVLYKKGKWNYIECGNLRGFVQKSELSNISELSDIRKSILSQAVIGTNDSLESSKIISEMNATFDNPEVLTVDAADNDAFTYKKITAIDTVIKKKYAIVNTNVKTTSSVENTSVEKAVTEEASKNTATDYIKIQEEKSEKSRTVGTIKNGGLLYIIADKDEDWVFVESGDVRGFVEARYLETGKTVNKDVKENGEDSYSTAKEKVDPEENKAFYYSLLTTVDKTAEEEFRATIIAAAAQCIGNPYVWGGTSLTNGADCSGLVQTIYRKYGISLPRVADDQSEVGTKITVESAEAGDLLFFADSSGYVYHVAISTGDGGTIEARSARYGIVRVKDRSGASWATDVISSLFDD